MFLVTMALTCVARTAMIMVSIFAVWSLFPTSQLANYNCEVRARREVHTHHRSLHKIEEMVKKT